jgi:hypothetical protein
VHRLHARRVDVEVECVPVERRVVDLEGQVLEVLVLKHDVKWPVAVDAGDVNVPALTAADVVGRIGKLATKRVAGEQLVAR